VPDQADLPSLCHGCYLVTAPPAGVSPGRPGLSRLSTLADRHFEGSPDGNWYSMRVHIHTMTGETQ
jgi:hypothetical protein